MRRPRDAALAPADRRPGLGERLGVVFTGISLAAILLVALGLAITYGLMGVINMAHGELMMIGAYSTYVVQNLFRAYLPAPSTGTSLPPSRPRSSSPRSSAVLERGVIRWLYGRPLRRCSPPGASA